MDTNGGTSNKRKLTGVVIGLAAGILALVIIVAVIFAVLNARETPEKKVARLLDVGQQYLLDEKYEDAIATYDEVLAIEPKNEKAVEGEIKTYISWSDALVAEEKYEEAAKILNQAMGKFDDDRLETALNQAETASSGNGEGAAEYNTSLSGTYMFSALDYNTGQKLDYSIRRTGENEVEVTGVLSDWNDSSQTIELNGERFKLADDFSIGAAVGWDQEEQEPIYEEFGPDFFWESTNLNNIGDTRTSADDTGSNIEALVLEIKNGEITSAWYTS